MRSIALSVLVAALALSNVPLAAASGAAISIQNFAYDPTPAGLDLGEVATWTNDETTQAHTVTADAHEFDSGNLDAGASFAWGASRAGTVAYHCTYHSTMHGKLYVGTGSAASPNLLVSTLTVAGSVIAVVPVADLVVRDPTSEDVAITLTNDGGAATSASTVNVTYVDATGATQVIGAADVPALAPGEGATVHVAWSTLGVQGDFPVTAFVDPGNEIVEGHEADNFATVTAHVGLL